MVSSDTQVPNPEQLDILHIKMKVGKTSVSGDLSKDLQVPDDPELIIEAMTKNPSMYFYWASVTEVARGELERKKYEFDMWYAERYMQCKKFCIDEFGKSAVTETMVKAKLFELYGTEYSEWQEEIVKAEYRKSILAHATKAFSERSNSLINILSYRKQEWKDSSHA